MVDVIEFVHQEMYNEIYIIYKDDTDSDEEDNYNEVEERIDDNNEDEEIGGVYGEGDKRNNRNDLNDNEK